MWNQKSIKRKIGENHKNMEIKQHEWTIEKIKGEIKKYLETNENRTTMIQNLWITAKAVLRGKFIVVWAYLRKQEKSQINNPTLYLKKLEKRRKNKAQCY